MSYNLLNPVRAIVNGDMTGDITSAIVETKYQDNLGVQLDWTGTPVGSFDVQISMDYFKDSFGNVVNAGHWISIPLLPLVAATGSADNAYIDLSALSTPWLRVVYTHASGAGTLNGYINGKGV